jgi:Tfp pilus assembly ATPase PilU
MKSFNQCLFDLVISKKISTQAALEYSNNKEDLAVQLRRKEII